MTMRLTVNLSLYCNCVLWSVSGEGTLPRWLASYSFLNLDPSILSTLGTRLFLSECSNSYCLFNINFKSSKFLRVQFRICCGC